MFHVSIINCSVKLENNLNICKIDMATFLLSERLEELVPHLHKQSSCHAPTCDVYSIEMLSDGIKSDVIKYSLNNYFSF